MKLYYLAAALATTLTMKTFMEPVNIMAKLKRLEYAIKTGKIRKNQVEGIDTRLKAYSLGFISFLLPLLFTYLLFDWASPNQKTTLWYIIAVTILGNLYLTYAIDKYHVEIEKLTQDQKK